MMWISVNVFVTINLSFLPLSNDIPEDSVRVREACIRMKPPEFRAVAVNPSEFRAARVFVNKIRGTDLHQFI